MGHTQGEEGGDYIHDCNERARSLFYPFANLTVYIKDLYVEDGFVVFH